MYRGRGEGGGQPVKEIFLKNTNFLTPSLREVLLWEKGCDVKVVHFAMNYIFQQFYPRYPGRQPPKKIGFDSFVKGNGIGFPLDWSFMAPNKMNISKEPGDKRFQHQA